MAGITHEVEDKNIIEAIKNDAAAAANELVTEANLKKGQIVVIGCSTSETLGSSSCGCTCIKESYSVF